MFKSPLQQSVGIAEDLFGRTGKHDDDGFRAFVFRCGNKAFSSSIGVSALESIEVGGPVVEEHVRVLQ